MQENYSLWGKGKFNIGSPQLGSVIIDEAICVFQPNPDRDVKVTINGNKRIKINGFYPILEVTLLGLKKNNDIEKLQKVIDICFSNDITCFPFYDESPLLSNQFELKKEKQYVSTFDFSVKQLSKFVQAGNSLSFKLEATIPYTIEEMHSLVRKINVIPTTTSGSGTGYMNNII